MKSTLQNDTPDTFPRQHARTRRLTLGAPRTFSVSANGSQVIFLRSRGGNDPVTCLWHLTVATGETSLVVDPLTLLDPADEQDLPDAERRRRERARESAEGIVSYALDGDAEQAAFALAGRLFVTTLATGVTREVAAAGPVFDPRLDPTGHHIAYVSGTSLRVVALGGDSTSDVDRLVAVDDDPDVTWGSAEFVAAEEMGRSRGFWWSPDGTQLVAARVDNRPVSVWHIADPANPATPPAAVRYPAAGTNNAIVTLALFTVATPDADAPPVEIGGDVDELPYLADVLWPADGALTVVASSRDQHTLAVSTIDPSTGRSTEIHRQVDDQWVELVPGAPRWFGDELVTVADRDGARRVVIGHKAVTPVELQVRHIVGALGDDLVVAASPEPTRTNLYRIATDGEVTALTEGPGVHGGVSGGDVLVATMASMEHDGLRVKVRRGFDEVATIETLAETPLLKPNASFHVVGARRLRSVVLLPAEDAGIPEGPLPVLCDPYGGPHAQRVVRSRNAHLASQWFADQGFAVVVTDGRGTPARGPEFERAVYGDLAHPVLEDQIDALEALAQQDDRLDLTRVGIRGWSFGGYLAALAVLRRPDIFHAGIAGAPVIDWRLYDTHYTERYLGHPDTEPENYERTDLTLDAAKLERPLMIIHGMADDNVVVAHSLRMSTALLEAGRPHHVLPLSGVTHMTPQEVVAENLLKVQVAFLKESLAIAPGMAEV